MDLTESTRQVLAGVVRQKAFRLVRIADWEAAASLLAQSQRVINGLPDPIHASLGEAFILLMAGRRREAIGVLEQALRQDPANGAIAHCLGLVCYHTVPDLEEQGRLQEADHAWERLIAMWVMVQHHDAYQEQWRQQAEKRYQAEVSRNHVRALWRQLANHLAQSLSEIAENDRRASRAVECVRVKPGKPGRSRQAVEVDEVTPYVVWIRAVQNDTSAVFVPVIPVGTIYPLSEPTRLFLRPVARNQRAIRIPVYEGLGEASAAEQGFIDYELPSNVPPEAVIEVIINFDVHRVLTAAIRLQGNDAVEPVTIRRERSPEEARAIRRRQRALLFQREIKSADALRALGGLPLPNASGTRLVCGPLMIQFLGLGQAVAELAQLDASEENQPESATRQQLRRYFSQLGLAQTLLELDRPQEALAALSEAACSSCQASVWKGRQPFFSTHWFPLVCSENCAEFDQLNPGYARLTNKHGRLWIDALGLAIEAQLRSAQSFITASMIDVATASHHWQEAVRLSKVARNSEQIQRRIVDMALGRSQALERQARLDEAIALLEAAEAVCDDHVDRELVGRLSETLTERGITIGSQSSPNWEVVVADLRRAVNYNPYSTRALINLGIALQSWAARRDELGEARAAADLLREAVEQLRSGLARIPGHTELRAGYEQVQEAYGVQLANVGELEHAVAILEQAAREFPDNPRLVGHLTQVRMLIALQGPRSW
jgi:tetratricopeptide (TPR) repeat protein